MFLCWLIVCEGFFSSNIVIFIWFTRILWFVLLGRIYISLLAILLI
jgi:hypothetical protein